MRVRSVSSDASASGFRGVMGKLTGSKPTDLMLLLQHRPDLFGDAFCAWLHALLRGESSWSVGERELMAAHVAATERCEPVRQLHAAVASLELGDDVVAQVGAAPAAAPVSDRLRAALEFASRLSAGPEAVLPRHVDALRGAGLDETAMEEVVQISVAVGVLTRVANALGVGTASERQLAREARNVLKRGYARG